MNISRISTAAAVLAIAGSASAQVFLNEIYASHSGTDNQEFIELIGPANTSLDGYALLVVEGQDPSKGTLDRVYDLTGTSIPASGYYVAGNTGIGPDFDIGNDNALENGTETFYLVSNADFASLNALLGTDLDPDGDLLTDIPNLSTVEDIIGMIDDDYPGFGGDDLDRLYDGATPIGPDGTFFPAGIFRGGDHPAAWCPDSFLDFDVAANLDQPRTPGATNVACPGTEPGVAYCFGTMCPCSDDAAAGCGNSTGSGALLAGGGSASAGADDLVLTITSMPAFQNGLIYAGPAQIDLPFGDGKRCVGGTVIRFPIRQADMNGSFSETGIAAFAGYVAGDTVNFQGWYRDPAGTCTGSAFNLSNGYSVTYGM